MLSLVEKRLWIDGLAVVGKPEKDPSAAVGHGNILILLHLLPWATVMPVTER